MLIPEFLQQIIRFCMGILRDRKIKAVASDQATMLKSLYDGFRLKACQPNSVFFFFHTPAYIDGQGRLNFFCSIGL